MSCRILDAQNLYDAFISGGEELIRNQDELNRINVFPVADGDTGTNLAVTAEAFIRKSQLMPSAGQTMRSLAEAALTGARGNSGLIFAEFLGGLSESLWDEVTVTPESFSQALHNARKRAYKAVQNPVEGTILSLIKDWAHSLEEFLGLGDFSLILPQTLASAQIALEKTPEQLPMLKESHVLDAGAQGFFHFLQGVSLFFQGKRNREVSGPATLAHHDDDVHTSAGYPDFRYCTEGLLRGENIDLEGLRTQLGPLGSSLIVAGSPSFARIHIHTDRPAAVMELLSRQGTIEEQKVDDMVRQYQDIHSPKAPIALVTDSVADIPQELKDRAQIHVLPVLIRMEGSEYWDGLTIEPSRIYRGIDQINPHPTTAQPSPGMCARLYKDLEGHYDSAIAIHVSSKLSGTGNVSRLAAEKAGLPVTVIDSKHDSGSQGLLVLRAAQAIEAGMSHEDVVSSLGEWIPKAMIQVSLPSLKYMVRGGRVSPLKGALAKVMNLQPIVSLDEEGTGVVVDKAFSRRSNLKKIRDLVKKELEKGPLWGWAVVHADYLRAAEAFAADLEALIGTPPLYIREISPVIGLNTGPRTLAVVTLRE
jgi:hypothetical protein